MEILGFLLGLGCLVLIAWVIAILGGLVLGRKHHQLLAEPIWKTY